MDGASVAKQQSLYVSSNLWRDQSELKITYLHGRQLCSCLHERVNRSSMKNGPSAQTNTNLYKEPFFVLDLV